MVRRNFLKGLSFLGLGSAFAQSFNVVAQKQDVRGGSASDREYWLSMLTKITEPVLTAFEQDKIKELMPVESLTGVSRKDVTHLEALGRSLAGLAPWLELGPDETNEGKLRQHFIKLSVAAIGNAVTPATKSYMNFNREGQPLVDTAFLAHALIRAPKQLWGNLNSPTQQNLLTALRLTRTIKPYYSNWLLFSAMVEAALLKFSGDYDPVRIDYALKSHEEWYLGDGLYGDGPEFHFDYYNSFVIQPMLVDIVNLLSELKGEGKELVVKVNKRAQRYAEIQERLISPEGTFPPVGRSLAYRCGAFQHLAQMSLQKQLSKNINPAQVRCALTAVIKKTLEAAGTFDKNGWLTIGFAGHQPGIGEHYISTGSLYLCTTAFLPLGLNKDDEFWISPPANWTSVSAFTGKEFTIDKAIE